MCNPRGAAAPPCSTDTAGDQVPVAVMSYAYDSLVAFKVPRLFATGGPPLKPPRGGRGPVGPQRRPVSLCTERGIGYVSEPSTGEACDFSKGTAVANAGPRRAEPDMVKGRRKICSSILCAGTRYPQYAVAPPVEPQSRGTPEAYTLT